jgi:hypothetical protein
VFLRARLRLSSTPLFSGIVQYILPNQVFGVPCQKKKAAHQSVCLGGKMRKISSPYTLVYKVVCFVFCLVLAAAASEALFMETMGLGFKFVLAMLLVVATLAFQILSFKLCDILLDRDTIMIKGIEEAGYISVRNIGSIKEYRFPGFEIVMLRYKEKTPFGKVTVFIPNRTGLKEGEAAGIDVLKETLDKRNQPAETGTPGEDDPSVEVTSPAEHFPARAEPLSHD